MDLRQGQQSAANHSLDFLTHDSGWNVAAQIDVLKHWLVGYIKDELVSHIVP